MKKLFLLPLFFLFFACSNEDNLFSDPQWVQPSLSANFNSSSVTISDLDNIAHEFAPVNSSRSGNINYSISTIYSVSGEPSIYVINFDGGGWALISATRKFKPILAYNEEGEFNVNALLPDGLVIWKDNITETIANIDNIVPEDSINLYLQEWNFISPLSEPQPQVDHYIDSPFYTSYFTPQDYNRLRNIMSDSISEWKKKGYTVETFDNLSQGQLIPGEYGNQGYTIDDILMMCDGMTYIYYSENFRFISCAVYRNETISYSTEPTIQSKWNQDGDFVCTFPEVNGQKYKAGCGPVAIGQLMRHFRHPSTLDWVSMPLTYGTAITSDFLYSIGVETNSTFGTEKPQLNLIISKPI